MEKLLALPHEIYGFWHLPTPCKQSAEDVDELMASFLEANPYVKQQLNESSWWGNMEVRWFPEYGCALLIEACSTTTSIGESLAIQLIALDGWEYTSHFSSSSEPLPCSKTDQLWPIGIVRKEERDNFWSRFNDLLNEARKKKDNSRRSSSSELGHQKTPSFIEAVILQALGRSDALPSGGFTDVGLHTGGSPRSTVWLLVKTMLKACFRRLSLNIQLENSLLQFDVSNLKKILQYLQGISISKLKIQDINVFLKIIECIAEKVVSYSNRNLLHLMDKTFQSTIMQTTDTVHKLECEYFHHLEKLYTLENKAVKCRGFIVKVHSFLKSLSCLFQDAEIASMTTIQRKARSAVFGNIIHPTKSTFEEIFSWLKDKTMFQQYSTLSLNIIKHLMVGRRVVHEFHLFFDNRSQTFTGNVTAFIKNMEMLLVQYRQLTNTCVENIAAAEGINAALYRSKEVLIVWMCAIICKWALESQWIELKNYRIDINLQYLKHLSLSNPKWWRTAHKIAIYIEEHKTKPPIFSFRDFDPTFQFAEDYSAKDEKIESIYLHEQKEGERKKERHWAEVKTRRTTLTELRSDLASTRKKLSSVEAEAEAERSTFSRSIRNALFYSSTLMDLQSRKSRLEREINTAINNVPSFVRHSLPKDKRLAHRMLFFFYMNESLVSFGSFCILSLQILCPLFSEKMKPNIPDTNLKSLIGFESISCEAGMHTYFNSNKYYVEMPNSVFHYGAANLPCLTLSHFGPTDIESFSPEDGVYYPDGDVAQSAVYWSGGGDKGNLIFSDNVFRFQAVPDAVLEKKYTEPIVDSQKQNILLQSGFNSTADTRGNMYIASKPLQTDRDYCSIRAYPLQQFRKIILGLRWLDPSNADNLMLYKQALYQLGEMQANQTFTKSFSWKVDFFDPEWFSQWIRFLSETIRLNQESPSNLTMLRFLSEMISFTIKWQDELLTSLSDNGCFVEIAYRFAEQLIKFGEDIEIEKISFSEEQLKLTESSQKQHFYYMNALISIGNIKKLTSEIVFLACKAVILACDLPLCESEKEKNLRYLGLQAQFCLAPQIVMILSKNNFSTRLFRLVVSYASEDLNWTCLIPSEPKNYLTSSYFEAYDKTRNQLFTFDVLSGMVLVNGGAPSSLPKSILRHPFYLSYFENQQFRTTITSNGSFRTVLPKNGKYYEFIPSATKQSDGVHCYLRIFEFSEDFTMKLELLDVNHPNHEMWSIDLYEKEFIKYSHWCSEAKNFILFRGKTIQDKNTYFMLNQSDGDTHMWQNHIIPMHLQWLDIDELRSKLPELNHQVRIIDNPAATVLYRCLQKFETSIKSIEFHANSNESKLFIYFTRYELRFEHRDGLWFSVDYSGYFLNECQQCPQTSWFTKYLLLSNAEGQCKKLIFAPSDKTIEGSCLTLKPYVYDINERFHIIEANTIESRLYLAYILSKYSSMNHNPVTHMRNVEMAMMLLRRSWKNTPFTKEEASMLEKIRTVCEPVSPSLQLLCEYLHCSNKQLAVLHEGHEVDNDAKPYCFPSGCKGYSMTGKPSEFLHFRQQLTEDELLVPGFLKHELNYNYECCHFDLNLGEINSFISQTEEEMTRLKADLQKCITKGNSTISPMSFPFSISGDSMIHQRHISFLQNSWQISQQYQGNDLTESTDVTALLQSWHQTILNRRSTIEHLILQQIETFPSKINHQPFEMLRVMSYLPKITAFDFLSLAIHPRDLRKFNPYLNEDSITLLHTAIVKWLELCVYENQLAKLCQLMSNSDETINIANEIEYLCCREDKYYRETIEWLVFEVEQNIMIRPNQLDMTLSLMHYIENDVALPKGAVHQLNMGEGKTRIIIPMLILYFGKKKGSTVTRLTILAELLHEAYNYFHRTLTNSALNCKLFVFPFHRNMPIDINVLTSIQYQIRKCREWGGCVLQAPSYFLSMILKEKESELDVGKAISTICRSYKYLDIIDECDEVLRSKYELVYACGDVQHLPDASYRFAAVKAVFIAMKRLVTISKLLQNQRISMLLSEKSSERFPQLQLLAGCSLSEITNLLKKEIADCIVNNLTYEYLWMSKYQHQRELIVEWIWNSSFDGSSLKETLNLEDDEYQYLLALRGYVAFDIVLHCLEKRHRVNYGVDFAAQGKRIAIPFVAADTPSLRSEFANVDCMLVYTFLSYCYTGLSKEQIIEVFERLLQNPNQSAQQDIYREWFQLNESSEQYTSIDDFIKIDLTNPSQVALLDKVYQYNMEVIYFFLTVVVFPLETKQYPHLILASSWDLCDNPFKPPVGFSGTRDNSFTYPLQVEQREVLNRPDLEGTTGSMLKLILEDRNSAYIPIDKPPEIPKWQCIVQTIKQLAKGSLEGKLSALIDAGGQITGITYKEFALQLTDLPSVRGVVYFDVALRDWMVIDSNLRCWHLASAPFKEDECFVFYDESRCRGADMKLCKQAIGLITLSRTISTDKLMQAAGRMRQLSMGQRVMFLGTQEVTQSIHESSGMAADGLVGSGSLNCGSSSAAAIDRSVVVSLLSSRHILRWTISNTIEGITDSIPQWSRQGMIFTHTRQRVLGKSYVEVSLELKKLYETLFQHRTVKHYAESFVKDFSERGNSLCTSESNFIHQIFEKIESCSSCRMSVLKTDEECERELTKEVEIEREVIKEAPKQEPFPEVDWDYSLVNNVTVSFSALSRASTSEPLTGVLSEIFGGNPNAVIDERLFCTKNFYTTIICRSKSGFAPFLRRADALLYFPKEKKLLILSEREADRILEQIWIRGTTTAQYSNFPQFWNLEVKLRSKDHEMWTMLPALLTLQLFNGVTSFKTGDFKYDEVILKCVCDIIILNPDAVKELIQKILQSRLLLNNFVRSDVEKLLMTRDHELLLGK